MFVLFICIITTQYVLCYIEERREMMIVEEETKKKKEIEYNMDFLLLA